MSKTSTQTDSDIHLIVTLFTTVGNTRCSRGRLTISVKMDWTISRDVGLGNVPLSQLLSFFSVSRATLSPLLILGV